MSSTGVSRQHAPAQVVRIRRHAEAQDGHVLLVLVDQIGRELRGLADENREHSGGVRIERAGVADPPHAEAPPERWRRRRRTSRRVPCRPRGRRSGTASPLTSFPGRRRRRRTAASRTRVASGSGPATVHPAAFTWPPPPNCAAIFCTSTSPLPRRLTFTEPSSSRRKQATRTDADRARVVHQLLRLDDALRHGAGRQRQPAHPPVVAHLDPSERLAEPVQRVGRAALVERSGHQLGTRAGGDERRGDRERPGGHVRVAERARVGVDRREQVRGDRRRERRPERREELVHHLARRRGGHVDPVHVPVPPVVRMVVDVHDDLAGAPAPGR